MPAMRKAKEIAKETSCRSNLRSAGLAILMYLDDNDHKLAAAEAGFTIFVYTRLATFPSREISGITSAFFQQDYAKKRNSFIYALVHLST